MMQTVYRGSHEIGVLGVERRILARLRNHTFFSLAELNQAMVFISWIREG